MPWALLADLRVLLGIALIATAGYAAVQKNRLAMCKAEFAQYQADVDREASAARVRAAQEARRHALNAQEVLDDLQTRHTALAARYSRLRDTKAGSGGLPALSSAAPVLSACATDTGKPDASAGFLDALERRVAEVLEAGDRELGKYVQLWRLQQKNAAAP